MKTIYDVYIKRKNAGLIEDPWPEISRKGALNMILNSVYQTKAFEDLMA